MCHQLIFKYLTMPSEYLMKRVSLTTSFPLASCRIMKMMMKVKQSDRNEELNDVGSEDYAEESRLLDHDSEDDEDETDKEEERVIALVQVGEDLFGQDDQRKELEELEKDQEETGVITVQPEELPITAETHETSHTFNEHNSSTSFLSSTPAKTVAKVIGETVDVKKLDRARNNL